MANSLTSGFASSAGHGHDSGANQRLHDGLETADPVHIRYTSDPSREVRYAKLVGEKGLAEPAVDRFTIQTAIPCGEDSRCASRLDPYARAKGVFGGCADVKPKRSGSQDSRERAALFGRPVRTEPRG